MISNQPLIMIMIIIIFVNVEMCSKLKKISRLRKIRFRLNPNNKTAAT